jgi:hypothetical protein
MGTVWLGVCCVWMLGAAQVPTDEAGPAPATSEPATSEPATSEPGAEELVREEPAPQRVPPAPAVDAAAQPGAGVVTRARTPEDKVLEAAPLMMLAAAPVLAAAVGAVLLVPVFVVASSIAVVGLGGGIPGSATTPSDGRIRSSAAVDVILVALSTVPALAMLGMTGSAAVGSALLAAWFQKRWLGRTGDAWRMVLWSAVPALVLVGGAAVTVVMAGLLAASMTVARGELAVSDRSRVDPADEEELQTRNFIMQSVSSVGSRLAAAVVVLCLGGAVVVSGVGAGLAHITAGQEPEDPQVPTRTAPAPGR